jgi:hypothetical protein
VGRRVRQGRGEEVIEKMGMSNIGVQAGRQAALQSEAI